LATRFSLLATCGGSRDQQVGDSDLILQVAKAWGLKPKAKGFARGGFAKSERRFCEKRIAISE